MKTIFIVVYKHNNSGKHFISGVNFETFQEALHAANNCNESVSPVNILTLKIDLNENSISEQVL